MKKTTTVYILQWVTAAVCALGAAQLLAALSHHAVRHLPLMLLKVIAIAEIAAAVLFVIPQTERLGGRSLLVVLLLAAVVHLVHGQYWIGELFVYAAAVGVVLTHK